MTLEQEPDPLRRIPTKHTADLRAEIGSVLKAAREKRGQSLDTVAQQTRISKRFLEAMENDRFDEFPAVVYLRGFLKSYCEFLDVDFEILWLRLTRAQQPAVEGAAPAEPEAQAPAAAPKAVPAPPVSPSPKPLSAPKPPQSKFTDESAQEAPKHLIQRPKPAPQPHHGPAHPAAKAPAHGKPGAAHPEEAHASSGATGAIALAVALAIGLGVYLFKDAEQNAAIRAPEGPAALQPLPRAEEPRLVIRLKNDAWLSVSLDGRKVYEGRAPRDAAQEWKPSHLAAIRTTDPSALEVTLNGVAVPLAAPGADGEYKIEVP